MNPEQQFARQICRVLDLGTRSLDREIVENLRAGRERAIYRRLALSHDLAIVGAGEAAVQFGSGNSGRSLGTLLSILALILGVSLSYYWNGFAQASINVEVDSALLAGDLPPSAYLDRGFQAWLETLPADSSSGE
jgi:hypothetical protein